MPGEIVIGWTGQLMRMSNFDQGYGNFAPGAKRRRQRLPMQAAKATDDSLAAAGECTPTRAVRGKQRLGRSATAEGTRSAPAAAEPTACQPAWCRPSLLIGHEAELRRSCAAKRRTPALPKAVTEGHVQEVMPKGIGKAGYDGQACRDCRCKRSLEQPAPRSLSHL